MEGNDGSSIHGIRVDQSLNDSAIMTEDFPSDDEDNDDGEIGVENDRMGD